MLYEGGRFTEAVYFYERAREVGEEDWPVDGLLADALMFAGRHTDAQTAFEAALADPKQHCAEWRLKSWALTNLTQRTGTGVQSRQQQAANERADVNPGNSASDQRQQLEEALDLDLLSGLAWFNFGVFFNEPQTFHDAFFCFLMAALCQRGDIEAWANALALSVSWKDLEDFVPLVAESAYFANGDAILEQMAKFAQGQPPGFPTADFLNTMEQILRAAPDAAPLAAVEALPAPPAHERLEVGPEFLDLDAAEADETDEADET